MLGDYLEILGGGTPSRDVEAYWNGDLPWATVKDLTTKRISETYESITKRGADECATNIVPANTLLISTRMALGRMSITDVPMAFNQDLKALKITGAIDQDYLFHFLSSKEAYFISRGNGATVKGFKVDDIRSLPFDPPPLPTQRRIAAVLDKVQALVANDRRTLAVYDQLAKSLFLEMFGDPVRNERGWEVVTIEDVSADIIDCPHSTPNYVDERTEFPCIRTSELRNGYIDWTTMKYLDEEGYIERIKRREPKPGDIVYGREGTFGEAAIIPSGTKMSLGQRVMLFVPDKSKITSAYFWAVLRSDRVYRQAIKHTSGSTVGHINIKDIRRFTFPLPPLDQQTRFGNALKIVEGQQRDCETSLRRSEGLFGSLLQGAFSGELGG